MDNFEESTQSERERDFLVFAALIIMGISENVVNCTMHCRSIWFHGQAPKMKMWQRICLFSVSFTDNTLSFATKGLQIPWTSSLFNFHLLLSIAIQPCLISKKSNFCFYFSLLLSLSHSFVCVHMQILRNERMSEACKCDCENLSSRVWSLMREHSEDDLIFF